MRSTWRCFYQVRRFATETDRVPLPSAPPPCPPSFGGNQRTPIDTGLAEDLQEILSSFQAPIRHAVAYGSGVYKQANYSEKARPMLDFIFVVSHPSHWHDINMHQHPSHYSGIARLLGSSLVAKAQQQIGASVWYNVDCLVKQRSIKYGVISMDDLCHDLLDWSTLYCAGRMQKPVYILKNDPRAQLANQVNLVSALRTALLLLPEEFTERQLYETITSLSYRGDPRMRVAENPAKVKNIVAAQLPHFQKLYAPLLPTKKLHRSGQVWQQDGSAKARGEFARKLPVGLKDRIRGEFERAKRIQAVHKPEEGLPDPLEEQEMWKKIAAEDQFQTWVDRGIQGIVATSALTQSLKGVLSVGPVRGVRYVWPKIQKRFSGS